MDTDLTQSPRGYQTLKGAAHATIATWTLTATLLAHSATAFIDGEAIYFERILPPPDATLVVTLQDASRVDAPAIDRASTSLRLAAARRTPGGWFTTHL